MNYIALALAASIGSTIFTLVVVSIMSTRWFWTD